MGKAQTIAIFALVIALGACALAALAWRQYQGPESVLEDHAAVTADEWLQGPVGTQLHTIERQLRGLDVAMAEIGYRFTELYFAGLDGNWDYANYHTQKIELALRLALDRRTRRAQSSQPFLNEDLPFVSEAIKARDSATFSQAMERLRTGCMKCHVNENVPFFTVELPDRRLSSIRTVR
jgi:hypothetical protein